MVKKVHSTGNTSMRQMMDKLNELINSQEFESQEELEKFLDEQSGKLIDEIAPKKRGRKTNVEKSQELLYQAMESSATKAKKLVKQALELNPQNIEAICLLGDMSRSPEEALPFYQEALEIGHKQLGEQFFEENKGSFWGIYETRPYMTAKFSYALCIGNIGQKREAIEQFEEMLELNPNDNQGVRYSLSPLLLETKQYSKFLKLHKEFDEESTFWLFNYALYMFFTTGISPASKKALRAANKANKYVLEILMNKVEMDSDPANYYTLGDKSEAEQYLYSTMRLWIISKDTPRWIASVMLK